jgi:tetratricopeptide (TPR) repeat protein
MNSKMIIMMIIIFGLMNTLLIPKSQAETTEDLFNKAMLAINASNYEDAILNFDKILEIDPDNIVTLSNRGTALIELERYEEAITSFDKILSMQPTNIQALNNKGVALMKLQKYEDAILNFDKILEIDPEYKNAKLNRFLALSESGVIKSPDNYIVQLQVQVRDSNGKLVGVIDTQKKIFKVNSFSYEYLNLQPISGIYEEDGKIYEKREIIKTYHTEETLFIASTRLATDESIILFEFLHHGYPLEVGDTATAYWIVVSTTEIT